jgi:hypothetical protein
MRWPNWPDFMLIGGMIHDSTNLRGTGKARPKLVVDITPENLTMPYF